MSRTEEDNKKYVVRLNRIEGQVRGIKKMIEDNRNCEDIITQISAINNSLKGLGNDILIEHMKGCMVNDIKNEKLDSVDEVIKLCKKLV